MHDALCEPRPIQAHLPILVGGSGPKKTLRTVAERADAWNTSGDARGGPGRSSTILRRALRRRSAATSTTIEKTVSFPIVLATTRAAAEAPGARLLAANGVDDRATSGRTLPARPTEVADAIRPYQELGFATVIVRMPAPYDRETIDRIGEVQRAPRRDDASSPSPAAPAGAKLADGLQPRRLRAT